MHNLQIVAVYKSTCIGNTKDSHYGFFAKDTVTPRIDLEITNH